MQIQKCFGLLLPVVMTCAGADIVRSGKPCADIVIPEKADAGIIMAAKDLQEHLFQISGAKLAIVTPDKIKAGTILCVGESSASKKAGYKAPEFKSSAYDIWVKKNCIVLNGPTTSHTAAPGKLEQGAHRHSMIKTAVSDPAKNEKLNLSLADDNGPMHAVSAFLEHLGVRFYAPGKEGTIIPKLADIRVGDFRETKTAAFARREYIAGSDEETLLYFKRLKSGSSLKRVGLLVVANVLKEAGAAHPEWAALDQNGAKLTTNDGCMFPKLLEPSLQKATADYAKKIFDANPELHELQMVLPALRGVADAQEIVESRIPGKYPQNTANHINSLFCSAVAKLLAKSHPGKKLLYQGLPGKFVPETAGYPANLGAYPGAMSAIGYASAKSVTGYSGQLSKIAGMFNANAMQQREWWNEYSCLLAPRQGYYFFHTLQQVRKAQKPLISGVLMDAAVDCKTGKLAEVPLMHLAYYINSKLLWDPETDVDALLDEYCTLWFGPAAAEMRNFIRFWEHLAGRAAARNLNTDGNSQLIAAEVPMVFELLAKASAKTEKGSIYAKRIAALEKSLAGLKDIYTQNMPAGKELIGEILPYNAKCDGKSAKYKNWFSFGSGDTRTEFAIAFTEGRTRMLAFFRCYEPQMKKIKAATAANDDCAIFEDDHVRIDYITRDKGRFVFAANAKSAFLDGAASPDEIAKTGLFTARDQQNNSAVVKRFADRWELEMEISLNGCGKTPGWHPHWGMNISRTRTASGKKEVSALVKNAANLPAKWRQFTIPKVDTKGREVNQHNTVVFLHPGYTDESVYTVKKAKGNVSLADNWNEKSWKDIPEMRLGWEGYMFERSSDFMPDARAKIQYDNKYIYVLYQVKDQYVRGDFKNDQDMVCLDSTMEFFIQPDASGPYFNFEANCIGTLLLYEMYAIGEYKRASSVSLEELKEIKRFSTLPRDIKGENKKPVTWRMGLQIPIDLFVRRTGVNPDLSGQVWNANVYRCADWTTHPKWLMWKKNHTFHAPDGFGRLIFE